MLRFRGRTGQQATGVGIVPTQSNLDLKAAIAAVPSAFVFVLYFFGSPERAPYPFILFTSQEVCVSVFFFRVVDESMLSLWCRNCLYDTGERPKLIRAWRDREDRVAAACTSFCLLRGGS